MRPRNLYLPAALAAIALAVPAILWLGKTRAPQAAPNGSLPVASRAPEPPKSAFESPVTPLRDDGEPALQDARTAPPPRRVPSDAELLVKGGVLPPVEKAPVPAPAALPPVSAARVQPEPQAPEIGPPAPPAVVPVPAAPVAAAANQLQSLRAADWKSKANQLVNALRAGQGIDLDHAQVMDFLQGKDLLGWPESYRNWIGDELMIVLVKDLPERAFADFRTIQENTAAPAAMRDYSVQHIGELVTKAIAGAEGADYLWQTLGQNDPVTLSTTLITLHLLSGEKPGLVSASRVAEAAQSLLNHPDLRTQITAKSILRK
jgi:hypothetical protein